VDMWVGPDKCFLRAFPPFLPFPFAAVNNFCSGLAAGTEAISLGSQICGSWADSYYNGKVHC
jgi:hypothetical protein